LRIERYDPRFRIYTDLGSPKIRPMSPDEVMEWLSEAYDGFGWRDKQSLVHQLARFITPYCRGLMGWDARFPLWHYSANRPRAGKDYLAGVTHMVYEGHSCEDSVLERESEETRKRITAALMSGRRMLHFANCQGHIQDACFIGAITSKMFAARNLDSTEGKADLKLPNEIEFSISANIGLTFRPDVEPRTRRISLMFAEKTLTGGCFPNPTCMAGCCGIAARCSPQWPRWFGAGWMQVAPAARRPSAAFLSGRPSSAASLWSLAWVIPVFRTMMMVACLPTGRRKR
jgi:hypothetical protein